MGALTSGRPSGEHPLSAASGVGAQGGPCSGRHVPSSSLLPFRSEALLPSPGMKIVSEGDPESWACLETVLRSV